VSAAITIFEGAQEEKAHRPYVDTDRLFARGEPMALAKQVLLDHGPMTRRKEKGRLTREALTDVRSEGRIAIFERFGDSEPPVDIARSSPDESLWRSLAKPYWTMGRMDTRELVQRIVAAKGLDTGQAMAVPI
jgi:hypothetical protein